LQGGVLTKERVNQKERKEKRKAGVTAKRKRNKEEKKRVLVWVGIAKNTLARWNQERRKTRDEH